MEIERAQSSYRILALEIRPRLVAFAVMEAPKCILDWGTRKVRVQDKELAVTMASKVGELLDRYRPATVVVRGRRIHSRKARGRIKVGVKVIRGEAGKRLIGVQTMSTNEIHQFFGSSDKGTTKHTIAIRIAELFSELALKLPPKRKSWKSEDYRMVIFDAAATGFTFLNRLSPSRD